LNINKLLNTQRKANATLRWLLLHTSPLNACARANVRAAAAHDAVIRMTTATVDRASLLELMIYTAQYELTLQHVFTKIVDERSATCTRDALDVSERTSRAAY
jgi:hypothetical protein